MAYNILVACEETCAPLTFDANGNLTATATNAVYEMIDCYLRSEIAALIAVHGPVTLGYDATDTIANIFQYGTYGATLQTLSLASAVGVIQFAPQIFYIIGSNITPNATVSANVAALRHLAALQSVQIVNSGNIDFNQVILPYIPAAAVGA